MALPGAHHLSGGRGVEDPHGARSGADPSTLEGKDEGTVAVGANHYPSVLLAGEDMYPGIGIRRFVSNDQAGLAGEGAGTAR